MRRILILGAGGIGGCFGGRLTQVDADLIFAIRHRRAAQLAADGQVVQNPHADFQLAPLPFNCVDYSARMADREQLAGLQIKLGAMPGGMRRIDAVLT